MKIKAVFQFADEIFRVTPLAVKLDSVLGCQVRTAFRGGKA
jgi:hypothetical protein